MSLPSYKKVPPATSLPLTSHIISMDKTFWQEMDEKKMEKMESVGDNELMQKQSRCKQTDVKNTVIV